MRLVKAAEAVGPLVEIIAAIGVGFALFYVYASNLSAGRFFGLISGIFLLYEPIKSLSKIHIVMQRRSVRPPRFFRFLILFQRCVIRQMQRNSPAPKGGSNSKTLPFGIRVGPRMQFAT